VGLLYNSRVLTTLPVSSYAVLHIGRQCNWGHHHEIGLKGSVTVTHKSGSLRVSGKYGPYDDEEEEEEEVRPNSHRNDVDL
jgi:hypothetical protein